MRNDEEIEQALAAGAPRLLLDNMDDEQLRAAVAQVAGRAELQASGGVTLETLRARAQTGVQWVSMGALTHSAPALDLSLLLELAACRREQRRGMDLPMAPHAGSEARSGRLQATLPMAPRRRAVGFARRDSAMQAEVRELAERAKRGDPGAQLPGAGGPGRRRLRRRLARPVASGGGRRRPR